MLKIQQLRVSYGGIQALRGIDLEVPDGKIVTLIGANGAGKSTTLRTISGLVKAESGSIQWNGEELLGKPIDKIISAGIAMSPEGRRVFADMTVLENLLIAGHRQYTSNLAQQALHLPILKQEERVIRERALQVLEFMGLTGYRDWYAAGLPYGVLKKIEIARTLMCDPQLIILDEPAAGLNDTETAELAKLIRRIQKEYRCTILLVEHDMGLVMDICHTVCAISFGKLLAMGTPAQVQADKSVQSAHLGVSEGV